MDTAPDDVGGSRFYLDDIVALGSDECYHFFQLKYKQHPSDPSYYWSFNQLLEKTEKGSSLLKKWSSSSLINELTGKIRTIALVTNGYPDEQIKRYLFDKKIDILQLKNEDLSLFISICEEIGSESDTILFFSKFQFIFYESSLDDLEKNVRDVLASELKITEAGINRLFVEINKISRSEYPKKMNIETIRTFCEFDIPRPLNQEFPIPTDFEFYDESKYAELISDLASLSGGVKIFYGKPGVGKSTYLSKLCDSLADANFPVFKHEYFISSDDSEFYERLRPLRAIESLKAEFKGSGDYLGSIADQNSAGVSISEYIKQISKVAVEKGKPAILIIDGLDHAVRFRDQETLTELLREICIPDRGFWLIMGTQESACDLIPSEIQSRCLQKDRIEIKGLSKAGVENIIRKNEIGLIFSPQDFQITELCNRIFSLSDGNPLILRYVLNELKNMNGMQIVTAYDCSDILPYSGDIQNYYAQLWSKISIESKTLLMSIASVSFKFSKKQLNGFLTHCFSDPSKISTAFKSTLHLLGEKYGKYSVFHMSFEIFIKDQNEFEEQKKGIKKELIEWLKSSEFEELRWTEEKKLFYDLGDSGPILSIDENWLLDALAYPRETRSVISQLKIATEAAFKQQKFGMALKFSKLNEYLVELAKYSEEGKFLWNTAIRCGNRDLDEIFVEDLTPSQLYYFCCEAEKTGSLKKYFHRVIDCYNSQFQELRYHQKSMSFESIPELPKFIVKTIALDRAYTWENFEGFISQFNESGWEDDLFEIFIQDLATTGQSIRIETINKKPLSITKRKKFCAVLAKHDLITNKSEFLSIIIKQNQPELPYICILYLILRGCKFEEPLSLPSEEELEVFSSSDGLSFEDEEAEKFSNLVYLSLIYGLTNRENELITWIGSHESRSNWNIKIIGEIFHISTDICKKIRNREKVDFSELINALSDLPQPKHNRVTKITGLIRAFQKIVKNFLNISYSLNLKFSNDPFIILGETKSIIFTSYLTRENFLDWLVEFNKPIIFASAYNEYISNELVFWRHNIVPFSERAQHYTKLAKLSSIYRSSWESEILKLGAQNLVAYGYHKDMFLHHVIESLRICNDSGLSKTKIWTEEIEQAVENISEYTDGDETSHFPLNFANLLGSIDPQFLYKQYFTAIQNEEFDLAQRFFASILKILDYEKEINIAIASTSLDEYSYGMLQSLSENGNEQAARAKIAIENHLGPLVFPEDETTYSIYEHPKLLPPYDQVSIEKISEHLNSLTPQENSEEYFEGWIEYHLSKPNSEYEKIYQIAINFIDNSPSRRLRLRTILDSVYPLVYQFDPEKAFHYVTLAQAYNSGWHEFFSDENAVKRRWQFVKDHFPDRYLEFYDTSINLTHPEKDNPYGYFVPLPRSLNFFILFDRFDIVKEITSSSVSITKILMANVEFSQVQWRQCPDVDEIDILLSRLKWPSPLVRERAACEIARLLSNTSIQETIFAKLIRWISQQKLDSLVAIGLLPLIKATETDSKIKTWIRITDITKNLPLSSIIIERLILDLERILGPSHELD